MHLARLSTDETVVKAADDLYEKLQSAGIDVLYDDSDRRPGEKFADADLLGLPHRIVISAKTVACGTYEYKSRLGTDTELLGYDELKNRLTK